MAYNHVDLRVTNCKLSNRHALISDTQGENGATDKCTNSAEQVATSVHARWENTNLCSEMSALFLVGPQVHYCLPVSAEIYLQL